MQYSGSKAKGQKIKKAGDKKPKPTKKPKG
jgi:hypothetical protein